MIHKKLINTESFLFQEKIIAYASKIKGAVMRLANNDSGSVYL